MKKQGVVVSGNKQKKHRLKLIDYAHNTFFIARNSSSFLIGFET